MSKLPNRPDITTSGVKIGLDQYDGLWITINGDLRRLVTPQGIFLKSEDFSDLLLPSILFVDEKGTQHEVSINAYKQLVIDNKPMNNLADVYTKKEVDDLVNRQILIAPNGEKWKLSVTNSGELTTAQL